MTSLGKRLAKLEGLRQDQELFSTFPDWSLEDQMEQVLKALRIHRVGGTAQIATDRQLHLMGLLCAIAELGEQGGEHVFPSGQAVVLTPDAKVGFRLDTSRPIRVEDLPEGVREYFERMDPEKQPEREKRLHKLWRGRGEGHR